MANTGLTNLYQTVYTAFNIISRELVGFIPSVSKDASAEMVTLNQAIRSPIVPALAASDIAPNNVSQTGDDNDTEYADLNITKQRKVSFHLTAEEEKGLMAGGTVNDVTMQRITQAFRTLTNEIESDLAGEYVNVTRAYGTPGTTPFGTGDDLTDATEVMRILDDNGAPPSGRALILNTAAHAKLYGKQPALFKVNEAGGSEARMMGDSGSMLLGFFPGRSGQLKMHPIGDTTALAVNNASGYDVGDTEITFDGGSAMDEALAAGDIVTFAGHDAKYVVGAHASAASGTLTLRAPGLVESVANDEVITKQATTAATRYAPSVAFSRDAFHLACRVPAVNEGGDGAVDRMLVTDPHSGLVYEITKWLQYRQVSYEVAICWGVLTYKPEHAALLVG